MTASVRFARSAGQAWRCCRPPPLCAVDGVPSVWVLDAAAHRAVAHPVQVVAWLGDGDVAISGGVTGGAQVVTAGAALLDVAMPVSAWAGAVR